MLSPSEFNNAVPKFTNGNYANNPVDPQYIEEPTLQDYNRGVEPLETLPAQWWNWLCNQFTSRFNKINTYVKNIFDEITQLLSLLNISPDGTESAITTGQLKNFFKELYPTYVSDKLELGTTYVPQTRTVNGHELTGNITITKSDVGLGNVDNTSDVDKPVSTAQATAISTAINALDVASVGGSGKYLSAISETDGKISATAGDISGTVTAGDSAPVSGGAVADILSSLPTDAVLHYSFDEVPDLPDGTAYYKKDNDFTDTTGWNGSATATVSNGKITISGSANNYIKYNIKLFQNQIILIKGIAKVDTTTLLLSVRNNGASRDTTIASVSTKAGQSFEIAGVVNANSNGFIFYSNYQWEIEISQFYIGVGSYSTPVIDNANGKWNSVSQSGIAVQGVSGKAIRFLGNNYIKGNLPWKPHDKKVFTVSGWFKNWDKTTNLHFISDWITTAVANFMIESDPTDTISLAFDVPTDDGCKRFGVNKTILDWNNYSGDVFLTGVFNGDNSKIYVNGINFPLTLRSTVSLSDTIKSRDVFEIGRLYGSEGSSNCSIVTIDDLLIFDRALTEIEVKALYYNKANTPKYYDLDDYKIANGDTAPTANSNNFVQSKTLYNFFGGNTSAQSWLGKVFGHLLGKTWSYCRFEVSNKNFNSITYGNGIWVACENNYDIWWSYDGEEWTKGGSTTGSNSSVCYGNGIFVASCNGSTMGLWWSEDGKTWNSSVGGYEKFIKKVFYGNNMWIACTSNNDGIYWSTDGKTWTKGTGSNTSYSFNYAHYANGLWVAGSAGKGMWWSSDGKAWTKGTGDGSQATVSSIYYANNLWVSSNNYTLVSSDGKNWTQEATNIGNTCAYFANGMWIATRTTGLMYNLRAVNNSWAEISNAPSIAFNFVTYANGIWIAGGTQLWWSYDGFNWVPAGGISTVQYNYNFKCIKYANGTWVVGSDNRHGLLYSNISNVELTE